MSAGTSGPGIFLRPLARRLWLLGVAGWLSASATAARPATALPAPPLSRFEFQAPRMGTMFRIVLFAPSAESAQQAAAAAFGRISALNALLSDYDPASELRRLEAPPPGTAIRVSDDLFDILAFSQDLADRSAGAFDVTVGPLVALWRESRRTHRLPSDADLAAARAASGHQRLHLDPARRTVALRAAGMRLDLGGVAKGWAADAALAFLAGQGLPHAMVAAGGDLALGRAPPGEPGWKVSLTPFGSAETGRIDLVAFAAGISTSGDSEQFVEIAGKRYSHILDPATGLGLTSPVAVTVVARTASLSDGLATAGSVLASRDPSRLAACARSEALVLVLRRDAGGRLRRETHGTPPPGLLTPL